MQGVELKWQRRIIGLTQCDDAGISAIDALQCSCYGQWFVRQIANPIPAIMQIQRLIRRTALSLEGKICVVGWVVRR